MAEEEKVEKVTNEERLEWLLANERVTRCEAQLFALQTSAEQTKAEHGAAVAARARIGKEIASRYGLLKGDDFHIDTGVIRRTPENVAARKVAAHEIVKAPPAPEPAPAASAQDEAETVAAGAGADPVADATS